MRKLIGMTDFVLKQRTIQSDNIRGFWACEKYAKFLKQPLTLGMFIPCDEDGSVLEEKSIFNTTDEDCIFNSDSFDKYQQAQERVLFEGFTYDGVGYVEYRNISLRIVALREKTIEDLVKYNLILKK